MPSPLPSHFVMPGLVPGIHDLNTADGTDVVDAEPGHNAEVAVGSSEPMVRPDA
jgi:hypothetical protein